MLINLLAYCLTLGAINAPDDLKPPRVPERIWEGYSLWDKIASSEYDEGPVPDKPWILVRETDAGEKILCGPTGTISTVYDEPAFQSEMIFEVELTEMVGEGFQPIYISLNEKKGFDHQVVFSFDYRKQMIELKGPSSVSPSAKLNSIGWNLNGTNTITLVVKSDSVSAYVNGKYFSTVLKSAHIPLYRYEIRHLPKGMGVTYVQMWRKKG
jgi:hypothetical protein